MLEGQLAEFVEGWDDGEGGAGRVVFALAWGGGWFLAWQAGPGEYGLGVGCLG